MALNRITGKSSRIRFARELFQSVKPDGWTLDEHLSVGQGGHSGVCVVTHQNGHQGVFRCLLSDADEILVERFHREVKKLTTEIDHPNVMKLRDWSRAETQHWYISALGEPLDRYWERRRELLAESPEELFGEAIDVVHDVASGLAACHSHGLIHRDIKPRNIVIMTDGAETHPVIIDFGIAIDEDAERLTPIDEATGNARFSPGMMQRRCDKYPPWVDIFSLAQTLLWMLTERPPKHYWQRPVDWRYVEFDRRLPQSDREKLRAFAATCSIQESAPANGEHVRTLIKRLFDTPQSNDREIMDSSQIIKSMQLGHAKELRSAAENLQRFEACFPQAKLIYESLRQRIDHLIDGLPENAPVKIVTDMEFTKDNVWAQVTKNRFGKWRVGPLFQLAIGRKTIWRFAVHCMLILPNITEVQRFHWRDFRRAFPNDSSPFTFIVDCTRREGRVVPCTWLTINPDLSLIRHFGSKTPLGDKVVESIDEVAAAISAVFSNDEMWQDAGL